MSSTATWNAARVDTLKQLWSDGTSAGRIAVMLGGVTRNAVIGKVHRLKLPGRPKPPPRETSSSRRKRGVRRMTTAARPPQPPPKPRPRVEHIPEAQRIHSVFDLRADHCRWPVGDPKQPGFFFCGGPAIEGQPYCEHHTTIATGGAA